MIGMKKGRAVWLVTWDWGVTDCGKYTDTESIAAIINSRRSGESVRQLVELLYVTKFYTLSQRMDWARGGKSNHLSHFGSINGTPWVEQIFCGHGPSRLYARRVNDLSIERNENGEEKATWTETATHSIQNTLRMG
jgi:hypothetical protein